jgi:hypothetical protein
MKKKQPSNARLYATLGLGASTVAGMLYFVPGLFFLLLALGVGIGVVLMGLFGDGFDIDF